MCLLAVSPAINKPQAVTATRISGHAGIKTGMVDAIIVGPGDLPNSLELISASSYS
jgi:hypothetical protein